MRTLTRRSWIRTGIIGGAIAGIARLASAGSYVIKLSPTPPEIKGPFYPVVAQKDKDFDLTIIEGHEAQAKGEVVIIEGRVLNTDGEPIPDATVDLWQANAAGRYRHPHDPNDAPLDPNFQGWAIVPSGTKGGFRFKTIIPGAYPASRDWMRPPHIHFKVTKRGYVELITQMYFPGHALNQEDLLLKRKGPEEQKRMIATEVKAEAKTLSYTIVLQKA